MTAPLGGGSPPLRIVHVVSSLKVGGMEHFVLRLAAAQKQAGHAPTVLALQDGPLREEADKQKLSVRVLRGDKIARTVQAASLFVRIRPHIINAHNDSSSHYAALGKQISRAKLIITNHGQGSGAFRRPSDREIALTDAAVAVSDAVAQKMDADRLGSKICTIYNGVDFAPPVKTRAAVRSELGTTDDHVVGIIVARIDKLKGHDTLLHALAHRKGQTPLLVLIAGDGAERENREQLARELGLTKNDVRFLGFRADVPDLLAASDFFVLPSLTEGLPLSVLEAMTHRLPTVATRVGGIPELITNGEHGFLVGVNEAAALANAISALVEKPELRSTFGTAAHRRVGDDFSFAQMIRQYDALYRRLQAAPPFSSLPVVSMENT